MNQQIATTKNQGDQRMWCAVILQALDDATSDLKQTKPNDRQDARDWFLKGGKDFRDVCSLAGLDHERVRVEAKRKIDDAIAGVSFNRGGKSRFLTHNGETLLVADWSRRLNIRAATIYFRLRAGQSTEQALSPRTRLEKRYEYDGKNLTIKEWSSIIGVHAATLGGRLRKGWSIDRALSTTIEDGKKDGFKHLQSLKSKNHNAGRGSRVERRVATPVKPIYTCGGESLTLKQWAERLGMNVNALHQRMSKGWSIEKTLTTPAQRAGKPSPYTAVIPAPASTAAMQPPYLMTDEALHRGRGCLETSANALGAGEGPSLEICSK
jgi:hypothetical protein